MAKAEGAASTAEQSAAFVEALKREKEGYVARLANAKAGRKENLTAEQLVDRIKQVDDQLKVHSGNAKPARSGKPKGAPAADEQTGDEPAGDDEQS